VYYGDKKSTTTLLDNETMGVQQDSINSYIQMSGKANESVRRDVLCNILSWDISKKQVRLIRIYLNKTYTRMCISIHMCGAPAIQNGLKHADVEQEMNGKPQLLLCQL
jgi:hypothetical protein